MNRRTAGPSADSSGAGAERTDPENPPAQVNKPLEGLRVLVLRPEGQAGRLAGLLSAEGAEPIVVPAIQIVPPQNLSRLDAVIHRLGSFDWIVFTSVNGADAFIRRLAETGSPGHEAVRGIAAIGPATAERLEQAGLTVDWMPGVYTTQALGKELPPGPPRSLVSASNPPQVCLLRAEIASAELDEALEGRGFEVERVNVYGTKPINAGLIRQSLGSVEAVALTSASIVESFAAATGGVPDSTEIFSIGPATSEACREFGVRVDAEAKEHTVRGLVEVLKARHEKA